jgi:8-oxo-dGTP diphosphatase
VAVIVENRSRKVLLLLRDDKPGVAFPNTWSLVGGHVERGETPRQAAERELMEEVGLKADLTLWKRYDYLYAPGIVVDQYIYLARVSTEKPKLILGEGREMRFFGNRERRKLAIGFEFEKILDEYLRMRKGRTARQTPFSALENK